MHLSKKKKFKQIIKLRNRKKYYNLRIYLIKKNQNLKKIENELLKTKLELQNQQKDYNLLILNIFLGFVIIALISLNFYKLALIEFGYLLIKNNSFIKETFDVYLIQKHRFNKYYKKKFPVFYYVLPSLGILSGLGMFYTGYLLNNIYQEILLEKVYFLSHQQEIQSLQFLFIVFLIIFFFYVIIDVGIAIYVIQKANTPIDRNWKYLMMAGRIIGGTTLVGSGTAVAGTVVAGAPEPSVGSNFIHTKTPFGRGWDSEPGDIYTKNAFMKLQQFTGNQLLLDKLSEFSAGENKGIVTRDIYQKLLEDPEIKNKIKNASNITDEELYQMGIKTLSEVAGSTAKQSVKLGFGYLGEKIDNGIESLGNTLKSGVKSLKSHVSDKLISWSSESFSEHEDNDPFFQDESELDMPEEEFEEKQKNVPDNSPGKKAKKDQDIEDARRRGLGKGKKRNN